MTKSNSTKGKTRLSMKGNKNGQKEITKNDRFQARLSYEDKLRLKEYCNRDEISFTQFLINAMVDKGILSEDRRS